VKKRKREEQPEPSACGMEEGENNKVLKARKEKREQKKQSQG